MEKNKRNISICRVYEPPESKDGSWFLVDRLWPRGLKKDELLFDVWLKNIAPSSELRKWFNHKPDKWYEFVHRYINELEDKSELIEELVKKANHSNIVLFYAAKDKQYNHAKVLKTVLESWPKEPDLDQFSALSR